eukprot:gnl/TRDRNA2_/TRDRNA2_180887_c0_seq1.p1 gnl/TRDRNA2_/TRDRNA2_180887_c0~~gnl/TRDRNA2_/TRDRNA2_180887_c0_seq1.p1  ORF type:complete len:111 (+),score=37.40 gnl/TRDRNA2_/TRDRNA2_180887_c0_seq1:31-333(+)
MGDAGELSPLEADFEAAAKKFAEIARADTKDSFVVPEETLLQCYGLYKQATVGDVQGDQPWSVQVTARSKWDAWSEVTKEGLSKEECMQKYIDIVKDIGT